MKRSLLAMLAVLAGVYAGLSWIDRNDDYAAEQANWKINRKLELVLRDPMVSADRTFLELEKEYKGLAVRFPDSYLAPQSYLTIGNMYLVRKNPERARSNLQEVLRLYPGNAESCAKAMTAIGRSFEMEGDWPKAQESYRLLRKSYPLTDPALEVLLYIARVYEKNGDRAGAQAAFAQAEEEYKKLGNRYAGSEVEVKSLRLLANVYVAQERWREAVETMGQALISAASQRALTPPQANVLLKSINTISVVELKDYDLPIGIYKEFIEKNSWHGLRPVLKKLIKVLEDLKANKVKLEAPKS